MLALGPRNHIPPPKKNRLRSACRLHHPLYLVHVVGFDTPQNLRLNARVGPWPRFDSVQVPARVRRPTGRQFGEPDLATSKRHAGLQNGRRFDTYPKLV